MRVRRVSIVTLLVAISGSGTALAGDGSVTVVRVDPNDPTSAIAKLSVKTTVYVDSPRTAEQFDLMKEQLQGFAKSMCDISDGLVSIDQIDFVNHPAETAAADIAWWQRPGRAVNGGGFGTPAGASCDPSEPADVSPGGLFYLYGTNYNPDAPQWSDFPVAATLAHEMSHSIFGLGDSYADIRGGDYGYPRGAGFTGRRSMSFGPDAGEFFVDPVYGSVLVDRVLASEAEPRADGSPLYTGNVFAPDGTNQWWLQNNSIMQVATGQVCRDSSGLSPGDYNPTWVNQACFRNEDCFAYFTGPPDADGNPTPAGTDFAYCPTSGLATSSELSVYGNADRDRFDMTRGEWSPPYPAGTLVPYGQVGRELVFAGFLYPTTDAQPDDLTSNLGDQDLAACQETDANGNCLSTCDRLLDATGVSQIGTAPTIGGSVAVETQCSSEHQAGSALCPGALAPSSPNNPASGTAPNAVCDGCVLANVSACAPAFGYGSDPAAPACGNSVLDHLEDPTNPANTLFEQCDVGPAGGYVMDPRLPTPGPLRCADFFSSYRNQVLGQDYAGATPQHRMAGGHVRCGTNCLYDLSECTFAAREPGFSDTGTVPGVQLYEAWQQSTTALSTQWFDEHGKIVGKFAPIDISPVPGSFPDGRPVDLTALGPSSHPMFAFFQRLYRYRPDGWAGAPPDWAFQHYHEVWELTLGMDAADFGGTPGELRIIRSFGLEFEVDYPANTGRLVSVNGVPFDASAPYVNATAPGIFVGGSTATTTLWDGNRPPQPATGPLADRGPGVPSPWRLGLDFTALNVGWIGDWQCANPALYCPRFGEGGPGAVALYARHELLTGGFEAPQYGDLRALMPGIDEATVEYFHRSLYNPALKRYDSSDHTMRMLGEDSWNGTWNPDTPQLAPESEWERLATTLCRRYGVNVTQWAKPLRESAAEVESDVPADCGNVVFNDFDANRTVEFNSQTEVFFLLDRSESMAQVDAGDFGISRSRLDHAKLAAREFFNGLTMGLGASEAGPRVGLLYYNDDRIVATPTEPSCSASGTCSEGTCESGECIALCTEATAETDCASGVCFEGHCLGTLRYSNTEITRGRFEDFTVPRGDAVAAEYPTPEGYTYTSGAIRAASRLFGGAAPGGNDTTKVIVDVTDGIPTLPHFPGPRPAFLSAIDEVEAGGNMHYWSLLVHYPAFDAASYASIDVAERKFVGMRPEGEDTPPLLFQAYANLRGAGLARNHLEPPSMYVPDTGIQSYLDGVEYDALVETGTSRLVFAVSDFDDEPDGVATVRLRDPSGEEYSMSTAGPGHQITVDPRASVLWAVPNPQPGRWVLLDHNHGSVLPTEQKVYVSALVESQQNLPQCKAYPRKKVYQDGDTVVIRAEAVYERPIETGASFEGLLMRPDGIVSKLDFEWSWVSRAFEARVEPAELCGRGQYLASVQCAVAEGSHTVQGERSGQPQDQLTDDSLLAPAFERQTSTAFYVDSIDTCPLPGTNAGEQDPTIYTDRGLFSDGFWYMDPFLGDADGDGIPNQNEPADDLDGDGVEDARDPDANNNEVPDAVDPEIPYGPASDGAGDGCSPWNASACCSSIGACVGALSQLAIYAEGQLVLQNGAQVLSDTGFAAVLNNGGTETHLAADVDVGTIWSHPGVFGGERAEVHGDLRTGGTLYPPQNDVEVVGDLQQGFSFEFPTLEGFAPSVTPGGTNPIVNSGQSRTLPPGAYGSVTVNSFGTLYLSSGRYDLRSLQLTDSSVAVLDLSAGPIYLYVTDSVMFQATTVVTGGSPTDLFVGYMGSGMVAVERAFTGTIVAPHGSIRLAPLNGQGEYVGSFFARNVSVEASGNVVRLAPFGHPWLPTSQSDDCANGVRDGSETDIDCGGSCASGCSLGQGCTVDGDCAQGACISGVCTEPPSGCSEAVAVDLGAPGQSWVVPNDGCVMVRNGFPSWWGTRNLQLQSQDGGNYAVPFAWSQSCTGKAGSGTYTGNWQSKVFGPVSSSCAVLIDLQGSGGSIALRYYAN